MFLNGEEGFIEKNKQKALHWLNLSCMEGFDTGCEEFEKINQRLKVGAANVASGIDVGCGVNALSDLQNHAKSGYCAV